MHQDVDTTRILLQGKLYEEVSYQAKTIEISPVEDKDNEEINALRQEINALKL